MASYPDFELADPAAVTWSRGQVCGPRTRPVSIRWVLYLDDPTTRLDPAWPRPRPVR